MEHQPITILGSTGSIGTQALEVCENNRIPVKGLAAFSNEILLEEQARRFHPEQVCIYSEKHYSSMKKRLADTDVRVRVDVMGLCHFSRIIQYFYFSRHQKIALLHFHPFRDQRRPAADDHGNDRAGVRCRQIGRTPVGQGGFG